MARGEILVTDGEIVELGRDLSVMYPDENVVDLSDCILMPGLVNAHTHIEYTNARASADALNFWDWIESVGYNRNRMPKADDVYVSAMKGALECAANGTTCLGDSSFTGIAARAIDDCGLRGVCYLEVFGQGMGELYPWKFAEALDKAAKLDDLTSVRIEMGISPHSVYTSNREILELCAKTVTTSQTRVSIHLAETQAEEEYTRFGTGPIAEMRQKMGYGPMVSGTSPAKYLHDIGLIRKGVNLAHCTHVSFEEIEMIASSGASVVHCPRSNAFLGSGIAPFIDILGAGAITGLGTDSAASCMTLDMFEEMRASLYLARANARDAEVITAKNVVEAATIDGAKSLGLGEIVGSLESGKRADMIALSTDINDVSSIYTRVTASRPSEIRMVMVDGIEIARNGHIVTGDFSDQMTGVKPGTGNGFEQ